ncbi:MAG: PIN domain nuclease [Clostridiales bacterium]|nr:PIN domain nuclease [Clostridiales bacterium]
MNDMMNEKDMLNHKLNKTDKMIRMIIAVFFGGIGFTAGLLFVLSGFYRITFPSRSLWLEIVTLGMLAGGMLAIGFAAAPYLIRQTKWLVNWWESKLEKTPIIDLIGAILGLIIGLIIALLIGPSLSDLPIVGRFLPTLITIFLGYLGASLGMKKRDEVILSLGRLKGFSARERKKDVKLMEGGDPETEGFLYASDSLLEAGYSTGKPKILDTSVIIDGRVSDIYRTGFLSGAMVIPSFVLTELQHIADSSDGLKRNRGRRGLDILNGMRKEMQDSVRVVEAAYPDVPDVDAKLVLLARQMDGELLTNDYNLNKVAELQGIRVLNINDLVNALKQVFLPGEELVVSILREGKEQMQGIGYLDDGTMIVVKNGKKHINRTIHTVVTSVLQTSAGRMIFVEPQYSDKRVYAEGGS